MIPEFRSFPKIHRLSRDMIITEKIDGSNGIIYIDENNEIYAGSRNRWLDEHNENMGFWHWVMENKEELFKLGKGYHYGEWWGYTIQRGYGLKEKRFSLFNVTKWRDNNIRPKCCQIVPILYEGMFNTLEITKQLDILKNHGSYAAPGYMKPEGIVIYHTHANVCFKKTILNDDKGKNEK